MDTLHCVRNITVLLGGLSAALLSSKAYGGDQKDSLVSAAGGIAAPSSVSSPFQNPAGLPQARGSSVTAFGGADQSELDSGRLGAGVLYGKDSFGLTAGGVYQSPAGGTEGVYYGLGVRAQSLGASFGLSGETPISPSGDSHFNAGGLFSIGSQTQLGAVVYDISHGADDIGAGLSYEFSQGVSLVADFATDTGFDHVGMVPALRVDGNSASLTIGYGAKLSGGGNARLQDGFCAGAGLKFSNSNRIELYYNQLDHYYAGLAFGF